MPKHYSNGTDLDIALHFVMETPDDFHHKKRFHTVFLRTKFYTPILKDNPMKDESFFPLRLYDQNKTFFLSFDSLEKYQYWFEQAQASQEDIEHTEIFGHELIDCLGPTVYLALNAGQDNYYELNPSHIQFLKKAIEKTKSPDQKQH